MIPSEVNAGPDVPCDQDELDDDPDFESRCDEASDECNQTDPSEGDDE
jgi:hypothetical protein